MASEQTPDAVSDTPPNAIPEPPTSPDLSDTPYPPYAPYPPYPPPYPDATYAPYPYLYPAPDYYPWMYAPAAPRLSAWALASMICGIVSIASFQTIIAVLAVIFGFIGRNEIKKSAGQVEGDGFATTGIVLGFIAIGIGILIIALYIAYFIVIFSTLQTPPG